MLGSADLDGPYRYRLERRWAPGPVVTWVGLNPSRADALTDDPTLRRMVGFSRAWGFAGLVVVNLFAWRAAHPAELRHVADPVGPRGNEALEEATTGAELAVACWGQHGRLFNRDGAVLDALPAVAWRCLGLTRAGQPRHPLYLPGSTPIEAWRR